MTSSPRLQASFNSARGVKAFAVQYISIILIILTFIVGAFSGSISAKQEKDAEAGPKGPVLVGKFTLARLFSEGEARLEREDLTTLQQFLLSHDLKAEIEVGSGGTDSAADQAQELALARSVSLYRQLLKAGVPQSSLVVWSKAGIAGDGAQVTVTREAT